MQMQQRFLADAAHQMKTPLAGLRTQAELALRETDPQQLRRSLRQIATSTERATHLINQLLALARAEHQATDPARFEVVELNALARERRAGVGARRDLAPRRPRLRSRRSTACGSSACRCCCAS